MKTLRILIGFIVPFFVSTTTLAESVQINSETVHFIVRDQSTSIINPYDEPGFLEMNINLGATLKASVACDVDAYEPGSYSLANRVSACGDWTLNKNSVAGYNLKLSTVTGYTFCFILAKEDSNGSSLDITYGNTKWIPRTGTPGMQCAFDISGNTITATIVNANNP